jgi:hypothetical protein
MVSPRILLASSVLLLASLTASAATNIVTNGDFEAAAPSVPGWVTGGDIFVQRVDPDFTPSASHGNIYSDASTTVQGLLSQTLSTTPGAHYTLEFDLYRLLQIDPVADNHVTVWFGSQQVWDQSNVNQDWTHYSVSNLIASSGATLLQFGIRGGDADYPALDNVSVIMTAIPEPSVAVMLAGGLLLIFGRRREKRAPPF